MQKALTGRVAVSGCTLESERLVESSCTHSVKKTLELREEIVYKESGDPFGIEMNLPEAPVIG